MPFTWTLLPTSWPTRRFSMISKIDCRDKRSVVKLLDWQIASDILTVTSMSFYVTFKAFSELILGHSNARQEGTMWKCANQKLWRYKAVLYWKFLNVLHHPDCQQTCFRNHLPHQHSPPSRQGHDLRSSSLSLFFSSRKHSVPKQKMTKLLSWQRSPVWKTLQCYREIAL